MGPCRSLPLPRLGVETFNADIAPGLDIESNEYDHRIRNRMPLATMLRRLREFFSLPSLTLIIGVLGLAGIVCTLGGIVLGSTGLIEHSTQYLSAALLMIGIGISLMVISGAIWRLSLPDNFEACSCYQNFELYRNCLSPYYSPGMPMSFGSCSSGYQWPVGCQRRLPPPAYFNSIGNSYRNLNLPNGCQDNSITRGPNATPPPIYQSTNSLRYFYYIYA